MHLSRLQVTLAILKPDIVANPVARQNVWNLLLDNKFIFVKSQQLYPSRNVAEDFYKEHKERFFYNRLVTFMSSGPIYVHMLARNDAIATWRRLMGPTKVHKAVYESPNSIRGAYGLTDTRNATHGSDAPETAKREIEFFFPDMNVEKWFEEEEVRYRTETLEFNNSTLEHTFKT